MALADLHSQYALTTWPPRRWSAIPHVFDGDRCHSVRAFPAIDLRDKHRSGPQANWHGLTHNPLQPWCHADGIPCSARTSMPANTIPTPITTRIGWGIMVAAMMISLTDEYIISLPVYSNDVCKGIYLSSTAPTCLQHLRRRAGSHVARATSMNR